MCINLTWNCTVCVGMVFSVCCARSCQALSLWCELNKDGVHFFTLKLECQIGVTSSYCVILKMMTLYDAIKTIQNAGLCFSSKKKKILFLFKQTKTFGLKNGLFFKKNVFFSILIVFQSFLWFSLDRTIWYKSRHYQCGWVRAAPLKHRSLVLKKSEIYWHLNA